MMADVSTYEDVPLPADRIWSVIGDFGGIRKWAVLVQSESVEDTQAGKVRTLGMPENRVVKELLAHQSPYSYTYTMLDRPEMADYRSTVAVVPLDANNSHPETPGSPTRDRPRYSARTDCPAHQADSTPGGTNIR